MQNNQPLCSTTDDAETIPVDSADLKFFRNYYWARAEQTLYQELFLPELNSVQFRMKTSSQKVLPSICDIRISSQMGKSLFQGVILACHKTHITRTSYAATFFCASWPY